jgi:hypothetical protein
VQLENRPPEGFFWLTNAYVELAVIIVLAWKAATLSAFENGKPSVGVVREGVSRTGLNEAWLRVH